MALDQQLLGRRFTAGPLEVTDASVAAFAGATGTPWQAGDPAPATYPIVLAFDAMQQLLADPDAGIALHNVIHGEQRFGYTRPIVVGDVLSAELEVASLRFLGGADIIGTQSSIRDASGAEVCTAKATLLHKPDEQPDEQPEGASA